MKFSTQINNNILLIRDSPSSLKKQKHNKHSKMSTANFAFDHYVIYHFHEFPFSSQNIFFIKYFNHG